MTYRFDRDQARDPAFSMSREWLLTNEIGGYAMGTISGINTRRYHGHLVAAVRPPAARLLLLAGVEASATADEEPVWLSSNQYPGTVFPEGYKSLESFEVGNDAKWVYLHGSVHASKTLEILNRSNACLIRYENLGSLPFELKLRPLLAHRSYHGVFLESPDYPEGAFFEAERTVVRHAGISLAIRHEGASPTPIQGWYYRFEHARELERGLSARDDLFCPCELSYTLESGQSATLRVEIEGESFGHSTDVIRDSGDTVEDRLRDSTRHFVVSSPSRTSIIAGYPWFTDWGRDTMVALPGVCLATGRIKEAREILASYALAMRNGLIPNRFTEEGGADYHTADATLWFANAAHATLEAEWDGEFAVSIHRSLREAWTHHRDGTLFGIRMDPADGLLLQGEPGVQLTWMDAKIGDWVVTPRHGKPVEIAGLWVNFLRIIEWLSERLGESASDVRVAAELAEDSFGRKFWLASRAHYFDTVDPYDASLRPNQVIAMALPFGPARGPNAVAALETVERELLTPCGLRTLGPSEPAYRGRFEGPLSELDAAYHQGTVWPWLLGPYVSAVMRLTGDRPRARRALEGVAAMLTEYGIGGIAEVYDGDPPQRPNGCPFQAWSVGELLRAWVETEGA